MGLGIGVRELVYVIVVALGGLALAAAVALTPWQVTRPAPDTSVVELITPGGVAGRRLVVDTGGGCPSNSRRGPGRVPSIPSRLISRTRRK